MENYLLHENTHKKGNYTVIDNDLIDSDLSMIAKAVLLEVLHLPKDWVLHKSWFIKKTGIGRYVLDRAFAELKEKGYLSDAGMMRKNNRFSHRGYHFTSTPTMKIDNFRIVHSQATVKNNKNKDLSLKSANSEKFPVADLQSTANKQDLLCQPDFTVKNLKKAHDNSKSANSEKFPVADLQSTAPLQLLSTNLTNTHIQKKNQKNEKDTALEKPLPIAKDKKSGATPLKTKIDYLPEDAGGANAEFFNEIKKIFVSILVDIRGENHDFAMASCRLFIEKKNPTRHNGGVDMAIIWATNQHGTPKIRKQQPIEYPKRRAIEL